MKVKILPIAIVLFTLATIVRVADIAGYSFVGTSRAENSDEAKAPTSDAKDDSKTTTKPVATADDKKTDDKKPGDKTADAKDGDDKKDKPNTNVTLEKPEQQVPIFTESEKQLLEKLAARRAELDAREKDLEMKESLVDASSKKLDDRLAQLTKLKADTETLLKTYNDHEDVKIKSMVKIYENMKPAAAAEIFGTMDADILVEIVDKMAEKKVSPILAAMDPKKAEKLTEDMVKKRSLTPPNVKQAAAAQSTQTPPAQTPPAQPLASN